MNIEELAVKCGAKNAYSDRDDIFIIDTAQLQTERDECIAYIKKLEEALTKLNAYVRMWAYSEDLTDNLIDYSQSLIDEALAAIPESVKEFEE